MIRVEHSPLPGRADSFDAEPDAVLGAVQSDPGRTAVRGPRTPDSSIRAPGQVNPSGLFHQGATAAGYRSAERLLAVLDGEAVGVARGTDGASAGVFDTGMSLDGYPVELRWPGDSASLAEGQRGGARVHEASEGAHPARREPRMQEPGPYMTAPARSLALIVETVRQRLDRVAVAESAPATASARAGSAQVETASPAPNRAAIISDEVVRILMHRMRALAREQRFRSGGIR